MRLLLEFRRLVARLVMMSRAAAVLVGATTGALGALVLLWRLTASPLPHPVTFDELLVRLCGSALALCVTWCWFAVVATVIEALGGVRAGAPTRRAWHLPAPARRWVLLLCGVALTGTLAPAHASVEPLTGPADLAAIAATLPFPDRVADPQPTDPQPHAESPVEPPGPAKPRSRTVTVAAGDSLWAIAAQRVANNDPGAIDRGWRDLYRLNLDVIGSDPDHLEIGQQLRLPRSLR